ncbi:hypothetical protein D3C74_414710 [compost metagenome]
MTDHRAPARSDGPAARPGPGATPRPASVRAAREAFLSTGALPPGVRPLVAESWRRSARSGVDPDSPQPDTSITDLDLGAYRSQHPLARAMPIVRDLLVAGLAGESAVVASPTGITRIT